jgi:hypothetical protein
MAGKRRSPPRRRAKRASSAHTTHSLREEQHAALRPSSTSSDGAYAFGVPTLPQTAKNVIPRTQAGKNHTHKLPEKQGSDPDSLGARPQWTLWLFEQRLPIGNRLPGVVLGTGSAAPATPISTDNPLGFFPIHAVSRSSKLDTRALRRAIPVSVQGGVSRCTQQS